jgi:hypothetical protein
MSSYHGLFMRRVVAGVFAVIFLVSWQGYSARPFMVERPVYHEKDGGYFIHRIPALLTTDKGTLLAFCEARMESPSDAAPTDVVLRRSVDNGKTWTSIQVVAHFPSATVGNPAPVQDRKTGVIWLLLTSNPAGETQREIEDGSPKERGPYGSLTAVMRARPGRRRRRLPPLQKNRTGPGTGLVPATAYSFRTGVWLFRATTRCWEAAIITLT